MGRTSDRRSGCCCLLPSKSGCLTTIWPTSSPTWWTNWSSSEITSRYEQERRGGLPYHPRMMVKVLLYGYCVGVASSRRIARRPHGDIAFRVLAAEVAELLRRAQEVDEEEDRRYGKDKRGDELPEKLAFREGRLEKIREAMAALEAEAQAAAKQAEVEGKTHPGVPDDKAQRNFTDAESRIMPGPVGRDFLQAYNCQAVVDHTHQVIVAARATNLPSDKQQAAAMMQETIRNTGVVPREVLADAGYDPPKVVDQPHDLSVEPVFGQIKEGRGFWQFLLRRLQKGSRRVVAHLHRTQLAQAVSLWSTAG